MAHKFKIGDRVRVRTLQSMIEQFGTTSDGSPKVRLHWCRFMNHLCGRTATILDIRETLGGYHFALKDWSRDDGDTQWAFSEDMLEPVVESPSQKCKRLAQAAKEKAAREKYERAAKRKQAKEDKARAIARDKARKGLPAPAKRALLYLDANTDAFGCQRTHVLGIVAALTGVHPDRIKKAYDA